MTETSTSVVTALGSTQTHTLSISLGWWKTKRAGGRSPPDWFYGELLFWGFFDKMWLLFFPLLIHFLVLYRKTWMPFPSVWMSRLLSATLQKLPQHCPSELDPEHHSLLPLLMWGPVDVTARMWQWAWSNILLSQSKKLGHFLKFHGWNFSEQSHRIGCLSPLAVQPQIPTYYTLPRIHITQAPRNNHLFP